MNVVWRRVLRSREMAIATATAVLTATPTIDTIRRLVVRP